MKTVPPLSSKTLANRVGAAFDALFDLACAGQQEAAEDVYAVLFSFITDFEELYRARPRMFEALARRSSVWPGFLTCDSDMQRSNKELLEKLRLGSGAELNYSGKQWSRDTPETHVALRLYLQLNFEHATLHPLSRANYAEWFRAAWPLFVARYGQDFENHKRFARHWKNRTFFEDMPGAAGRLQLKPKARALIRDHIRKKIRQSFRSIAPRVE